MCADVDFKKVFNFLFETVRGLLIYAKEGKYDIQFLEENLIPQLSMVISKCYLDFECYEMLGDLLSQTVAGKKIQNDDKINDLLNYTIGTLKCFSTSSKQVQQESVSCQLVSLLSITIQKVMEEFKGTSATKKAQILVQITGTLRNLANVEESHE